MDERLIVKNKKDSKAETQYELTKPVITALVLEGLTILAVMFLASCLLWGVMLNAGEGPLPFELSKLFLENKLTLAVDSLTNSNISRDADSWGFTDTYGLSIVGLLTSIFLLYKAKGHYYIFVVGHAISLCLFLILLVACTLIAVSY